MSDVFPPLGAAYSPKCPHPEVHDPENDPCQWCGGSAPAFEDMVEELTRTMREREAADHEWSLDPEVMKAQAAVDAAQLRLGEVAKPHRQRMEDLSNKETNLRAQILASWPHASEKTIRSESWEVQRRMTPRVAVASDASLLESAWRIGILPKLIKSVKWDERALLTAAEFHEPLRAHISVTETATIAVKLKKKEAPA